MTVSEKIVLREDVAGPAARAATKVEQLAGALGRLGNVDVEAGAAAKIERAARAASKANDRATAAAERAAAAKVGLAKADEKARIAREHAATAGQDAGARAEATAKKAAELREASARAEEKAREAAERAARMKADGVSSEKAELIAARAASKAARMRVAADRVEASARKASEVSIDAQSKAEGKATKAAEEAAKRRAAALRIEDAAKKAAAKAEDTRSKAAEVTHKVTEAAAKKAAKVASQNARRLAGLNPDASKAEARLLDQLSKFNPHQERREAMLQRQLDDMRAHARGESRQTEPRESTAFSGIGSHAAMEVLRIATSAASVAGRAVVDLGVATVHAAAFREDATRALGILRRTKGDADKVLATATATADFIGQGRQETLSQFINLLGKFESSKLVDRIVRSIADLGTVNPEANVDAIIRAMGKIQAQGWLQGDELTMLTEAGLAADKVYGQLSARMGKTVDEIKKMQSAGKLDAANTIESILGAINEQTGGRSAGLAARAKSLEDMAGLAARVSAMPGNLLADLQVTPGMHAYKTFLAETIESLDPAGPRWQRITGVLGSSVNATFEAMFKGRDPGAFIDSVISKVEAAAPLVNAALSGFNTGFTATLRVFERLDQAMESGPLAQIKSLLGLDRVPWIEMVARGVGLIAGIAGVAVAGIGLVGSAWAGFLGKMVSGSLLIWSGFAGAFEFIHDAITGEAFVADGKAIGDAIVDGLLSGLNSGAQAVVAAVRALAAGTISTGKKAFGIASPSKPFMEIGGFVTEGAEVGIEAGAARVIRAAKTFAYDATAAANDALVAPAAAGLLPAGRVAFAGPSPATRAAAAAAGSPQTVINIEEGAIAVNITTTETVDGETIGRHVWDVLRRLAKEGG